MRKGAYIEYVTDRTRKNAPHRKQSRRLFWVVWLSDKAYTVDALAVRGDEGRVSLRKAVVS